MKTVAFFNNKGGVGKTTLVYHLSWMLHELGIDVVALDLDPQANLTAAFLRESRIEELWKEGKESGSEGTIFRAVGPLLQHLGDLQDPFVEPIEAHLSLVPGALALGRFEDRLAEAWPKCLTGDADAFRVTTAFYRAALRSAEARSAAIVLVDLGPSLGALSRAALVASDYVVVPLALDLFSLQGLSNLGPTLKVWREGWQKRVGEAPADAEPPLGRLPSGEMKPAGYVMLQHGVRADRPVRAYQRWAEKIPGAYRSNLLGLPAETDGEGDDPNCLARLRHYRSLMPLAQSVRKPMFLLKPADGALGSHADAVAHCYRDFRNLAFRLLEACGLS